MKGNLDLCCALYLVDNYRKECRYVVLIDVWFEGIFVTTNRFIDGAIYQLPLPLHLL